MQDDVKKQWLARFEPKDRKATLKCEHQLTIAEFSPCGKFLLAAGFSSVIRRWDATDDKFPELPPLEGHGGWVQTFAFHPQGKLLFSADSWGQLRCWNLAADKPATQWSHPEAHAKWIHHLAVSPDGSRVATVSADKTLKLWQAETGQLDKQLVAETDASYCHFRVTFAPDSQSVFTGDSLGIIRQWDIATGKPLRELDAKILAKEHRLQDVGGVRAFCWSEEGKTLIAGGVQPANGGNVQGVPTIVLFDPATGTTKKTLKLGTSSDVYVTSVRWHPEKFLLISTSGSPGRGQLLLLRPEDEAPIFTTTKTANPLTLALRPDGSQFVVTSSTGNGGNGRQLKDGKYVGNFSPLVIYDFPKPTAATT